MECADLRKPDILLDQRDHQQTNTKHGWQVAAFAQEPIYQGNFSLPELNTLGVPKAIKTLKSYSDHAYPYSVCDCKALPHLYSDCPLFLILNFNTTLY
jgi:hypothetical protein